jgi:hypothetical protein
MFSAKNPAKTPIHHNEKKRDKNPQSDPNFDAASLASLPRDRDPEPTP